MLRNALNYWVRWETPIRKQSNAVIARYAARLTGTVIELGGFGEGRRALATSAREYIVTNVTGEGRHLDAAKMELADGTIDGILCENMLEHVPDPRSVVAEMRRVLRPGGRVLILTPWMYPYHAAPEDYQRFSEAGLRAMLDGFEILESAPIGNFWTGLSTFAQLKVSPWREMSKSERLTRLVVGTPLLLCGAMFLGLSRVMTESDEFAGAYAVLAEKIS